MAVLMVDKKAVQKDAQEAAQLVDLKVDSLGSTWAVRMEFEMAALTVAWWDVEKVVKKVHKKVDL